MWMVYAKTNKLLCKYKTLSFLNPFALTIVSWFFLNAVNFLKTFQIKLYEFWIFFSILPI